MRISHRTRLTLATSSVCGLILAVLFGVAIYINRTIELMRAHDILRPAIIQERIDSEKNGLTPDLGDVVGSNPNLSFGAFDMNGALQASEGSASLMPTFKWAYSQIDKRTGHSGIHWDIIDIAGDPYIVGSTPIKDIHGSPPRDGLLVGVLPWKERGRTMNVGTIALIILWFPLVGLVGAVTWVAAARTFEPLNSLTRQAAQFSESDLSTRLVVASQDEFGRFAVQLNHFLDQIQDSVRKQEQFVGDAAHELRTPLTILRGRIETTLLSERGGEEYRDALHQILRETERMSRLVEAMLQSALPVHEVTEPLDAELILERAHARWLDRYIESNVQLDLETDSIKVVALEEEFDCIVDNLLTNALRASPHGSTCRVKLEPDGSFALITVTDEGTGVPADKREAIFERFTRLEKSRNRALGGFGVGLAVSRRLVEARNGTIRVTDGPTGGARFEVRWPAAA